MSLCKSGIIVYYLSVAGSGCVCLFVVEPCAVLFWIGCRGFICRSVCRFSGEPDHRKHIVVHTQSIRSFALIVQCVVPEFMCVFHFIVIRIRWAWTVCLSFLALYCWIDCAWVFSVVVIVAATIHFECMWYVLRLYQRIISTQRMLHEWQKYFRRFYSLWMNGWYDVVRLLLLILWHARASPSNFVWRMIKWNSFARYTIFEWLAVLTSTTVGQSTQSVVDHHPPHGAYTTNE